MLRSLLACFPPLLTACGGSAAAGALATRADSASITIVTNTDASWREGEGWRIDETPIVQIGHRGDDDPRYDLLRLNAGRLLPNGSILVAVGGHQQLREFTPQGEWVRSIGRQGDGPGEFRAPTTIALAGDTIIVVDFQASRVTVLDRAGTPLTSWTFPQHAAGGRVIPHWRLDDGRWLGTRTVSFGTGVTPTSGISRPLVTWFQVTPDGSAVGDSVVTVPGDERLMEITTGPGGELTSVAMITLPVGRATVATGTPTQILIGDNDVAEIHRLTPEGRLEAIIRWEAPSVPVDPAFVQRLKQARIDASTGTEGALRSIERVFSQPPRAATLPYFSNLFLDSQGHLWVQEYDPFPRAVPYFRIFHPDGQYLGRRALPPRTRVLEIGNDKILTVWQDDDDLEYLRVYRLHR